MKLSIFLLFCLFLILDLVNSTKRNYGKDGQHYFNPFRYRDAETSETGTSGNVGTGTGSMPSNTEGYTQEVNPSGLETFQTLSNLNQDLGNHPYLFSPQHQQMNVGGQELMENQGVFILPNVNGTDVRNGTERIDVLIVRRLLSPGRANIYTKKANNVLAAVILIMKLL
uniref:Uncharacterized protein n=1 Tax=Meloidogyne enterolobii TaxID=390850 RepID=A0A6V7XKW7_MELEN|nr:unnamed protein product [Meloidogyne enterolobii]